MYNIYTRIVSDATRFRQLRCGEMLFTIFNCPLDQKFADNWSHHSYLMYVIEGRKIWHTAHGAYDLGEGSCVFVRKGACIVEQFFDTQFCFVLFFLPDDFIADVLKSKTHPILPSDKQFDPIIPVDNDVVMDLFMQSMMPYRDGTATPDPALLELKFRELVLTVADNPVNKELRSYFCSILQCPQDVSLQRIMEDNFCFNLKMEDFAKLCARSLSAFKRDFQRIYAMPPGKWLMEKRLQHAQHLLLHQGQTVTETAFACGFESNAHFSRAFRTRFGQPPAAMRRQQAG